MRALSKQKIHTPEEKLKRKNKVDEYFKQNKDSILAKRKIWVENNKERLKLSKKEWRERKLLENPNYGKGVRRQITELHKMHIRMLQSFRRLIKRKFSTKAVFYTGCLSFEEFIVKMSAKTNNPNWISDGYHIDHIWQVHWFKDFFDKTDSQAELEELFKTVNNIRNLRPLPSSENLSRPNKDFSPLKEEDLIIYEPYLNIDILREVREFFKK